MKQDRLSQRADVLAEALGGGRVLHLRDAAALLGVSEMTVRRTIAGMEDRFGYLGGYIVPRRGERGYALDREQAAHARAKAAVAARAAALVEDDDTVFIDCGTTTPHFVRHLPPDRRLTAVCYALNVAEPLAANPNVRLIMLGGLFNASSASFAVDAGGLAALERIGINKAFLSAGGVHGERGVSCSNFHEVPVKQAALRLALRRVLLVDDSKLGKLKPAFFADCTAFDTLVTNPGPAVEALRPSFPATILTAEPAPPGELRRTGT